jgi:hypothetical protein
MRLVVSLLTAVWSIAAAKASATGVATPPSHAGAEAQHHRRHQEAFATLSEAGRRLYDHMRVDRPSAVPQHSLLLT